MDKLDEEFRKVTEAADFMRTNGKATPPAAPIPMPAPASEPGGRYDFESLGERIAQGLVQAAEEQLTAAQNMLAQTQAFAEDMRVRVQEKARELADMNARLKAFGSTIVEAHHRFHGEAPTPETPYASPPSAASLDQVRPKK